MFSLLLILLLPGSVLAFELPETFETPSSGTPNFFTGSPRAGGQGCDGKGAMQCHQKATPEYKAFTLIPSSNMRRVSAKEQLQYKPFETWTFLLKINVTGYTENGLTPANENGQNGLVAEVVDASGKAVGELTTGDNTILNRQAGAFEANTVILDEDSGTRVPLWGFSWVAPDKPAGPVKLYLSAVDGDGDRTAAGDTYRGMSLTIYPDGEAPQGDLKIEDTTGGTPSDGTAPAVIPVDTSGLPPADNTANGDTTQTPAASDSAQGAFPPAANPAQQPSKNDPGGCGCIIAGRPQEDTPFPRFWLATLLPLAYALERRRLKRR